MRGEALVRSTDRRDLGPQPIHCWFFRPAKEHRRQSDGRKAEAPAGVAAEKAENQTVNGNGFAEGKAQDERDPARVEPPLGR